MTTDEKYMYRCLQLAQMGNGNTKPNPLVGCVIVHEDKIIGEGYHMLYGTAHAEPNAINSVVDKSLLTGSTLYVNLEPCSHFGKTPPCAALIIEKEIPRVVICNSDPYPKVSGRGIKMLEDAGIDVTVGVLEAEGRELNKRFFTFYEKSRPYIILKWAQSADGYIDNFRMDNSIPPALFSTPVTQKLNHKVRTEEAAILVGTNTVLLDNPKLNSRLWEGSNPVRIAIDREGKIGDEYALKDGSVSTIIFTEKALENKPNLAYKQIDFSQDILFQVMEELRKLNLTSLIVEGGCILLQSFIDDGLWDEARVEIAPIRLGAGVPCPSLIDHLQVDEQNIEGNRLLTMKHI